jgi:hypothetical protein
MKPSPSPLSHTSRALPVLSKSNRPQPPRTMRATVLQSLLLAPDGGVPTRRHGQGRTRAL